MEHIKRNERLTAMTRVLTGTPNRQYTLSFFCNMFGAAKSTVSEDISILSATFAKYDLGTITTVAGAAGGVVFRAVPSKKKMIEGLEGISKRLSEGGRLLPGDFLYTTDLTCDSDNAQLLGEVLASRYYDKNPDFVLTMETKGIPVAMVTARTMNIPLVIARRDTKAYDGSAVRIHYMTGDDRVEMMALPRRAVTAGQKALIIDDFMKGGGTLKGMHELMSEFNVTVVGTGVVIATAKPEKKSIDDVTALMILSDVDNESGRAIVTPAEWIYE